MLIPPDTLILIIDDIATIRLMLKKHLQEMGFTTPPLEASGVKEALALIEEHKGGHIGFILCDWNFPDGVGLQILKKTRSLVEYNETPFVMVTTQNEVEYMLEAIEQGANNYIIKPWNPKELQDKMQWAWKTLKTPKESKTVQKQISPTDTKTPTRPHKIKPYESPTPKEKQEPITSEEKEKPSFFKRLFGKK